MTEIQAFLHGRFPRSEELVQATRDLDRDRTTEEEVRAVRDKDRQRLLERQDKAGLSPASDGQLSWQDAFRPLTEATMGLEPGPLVRYFDTNTFYRRVELQARMFYEELPDHARPKLDGRDGVVSLPGPHWCAYDFADEVWGNPINRIEAINHEVLLKVAADLAEDGVSTIVFEEPIVVKEAEGVDLAQEAWRAFGDLDVRTVVHFPYYDAAWALSELDPTATTYGVDLFATDLDELDGLSFPKGLAVGAVDTRRYRREEPAEIVDHVTDLLDRIDTPWLGLTTNTHPEFLPDHRAFEKADALAEAADKLREVA